MMKTMRVFILKIAILMLRLMLVSNKKSNNTFSLRGATNLSFKNLNNDSLMTWKLVSIKDQSLSNMKCRSSKRNLLTNLCLIRIVQWEQPIDKEQLITLGKTIKRVRTTTKLLLVFSKLMMTYVKIFLRFIWSVSLKAFFHATILISLFSLTGVYLTGQAMTRLLEESLKWSQILTRETS